LGEDEICYRGRCADNVGGRSSSLATKERRHHDRSESAGKLSDARKQLLNEEQPIHPLYAYLYVVDKYEGLILVNAATLLDGDPLNNYLKRSLDPGKYSTAPSIPVGALNDANNITIAGHYAYVTTARGLVVVDIDEPLNPRIAQQISTPELRNPRAIAIQFRYGFIVDDDGLKVLDLSAPGAPRLLSSASVPLAAAHDVYVAGPTHTSQMEKGNRDH